MKPVYYVIIAFVAGILIAWYFVSQSNKGKIITTAVDNAVGRAKGCQKHVSSTGAVWYTYGDVEVSAEQCGVFS